jgi:hypothetical protein
MYDRDTKYSKQSSEEFGLLILGLFCVVLVGLANFSMLVIGYLTHSAFYILLSLDNF